MLKTQTNDKQRQWHLEENQGLRIEAWKSDKLQVTRSNYFK